MYLYNFNPCCSGRWSRTSFKLFTIMETTISHWSQCRRLNPCCSGQWSSTRLYKTLLIINKLKNFTKEIFTFLN